MRYLKGKKIPKQFVILQDDREKHPWDLPYKVKTKRLKTADYTIEGYEDVIAIEKKSGIVELLNDLANGYRPTFERFLKRLSEYPVKVMVIEDTLSELSISRALAFIRRKSGGKSRLTARTIHYWVAEIAVRYGVPVVFVNKGLRDDLLPEVFRAAHEAAIKL